MAFDEHVDVVVRRYPDTLLGADDRGVGQHEIAHDETRAVTDQASEFAFVPALANIGKLLAQGPLDQSQIVSGAQIVDRPVVPQSQRFSGKVKVQPDVGLLKGAVTLADDRRKEDAQEQSSTEPFRSRPGRSVGG